MRFVVLPLSAAGYSMPAPPDLYWEIAGHLFLVGLPIALFARLFVGKGLERDGRKRAAGFARHAHIFDLEFLSGSGDPLNQKGSTAAASRNRR